MLGNKEPYNKCHNANFSGLLKISDVVVFRVVACFSSFDLHSGQEEGLDVLFGAPTNDDDMQSEGEADKETSNTPHYAGYNANAHDPWSLQADVLKSAL